MIKKTGLDSENKPCPYCGTTNPRRCVLTGEATNQARISGRNATPIWPRPAWDRYMGRVVRMAKIEECLKTGPNIIRFTQRLTNQKSERNEFTE